MTIDHEKDKNGDDSAPEENALTEAMVEEEAKLAENTQKEDDKRMEEEVSLTHCLGLQVPIRPRSDDTKSLSYHRLKLNSTAPSTSNV